MRGVELRLRKVFWIAASASCLPRGENNVERPTNLVGQMIHNFCAGGQRWIVPCGSYPDSLATDISYFIATYCTGFVVQYSQPLFVRPSSMTT